jgi:hypothetical protein
MKMIKKATKYELFKRCLNCGGLNENKSFSCSFCSCLFLGEATSTEIKEKELIFQNAREDYEVIE